MRTPLKISAYDRIQGAPKGDRYEYREVCEFWVPPHSTTFEKIALSQEVEIPSLEQCGFSMQRERCDQSTLQRHEGIIKLQAQFLRSIFPLLSDLGCDIRSEQFIRGRNSFIELVDQAMEDLINLGCELDLFEKARDTLESKDDHLLDADPAFTMFPRAYTYNALLAYRDGAALFYTLLQDTKRFVSFITPDNPWSDRAAYVFDLKFNGKQCDDIVPWRSTIKLRPFNPIYGKAEFRVPRELYDEGMHEQLAAIALLHRLHILNPPQMDFLNSIGGWRHDPVACIEYLANFFNLLEKHTAPYDSEDIERYHVVRRLGRSLRYATVAQNYQIIDAFHYAFVGSLVPLNSHILGHGIAIPAPNDLVPLGNFNSLESIFAECEFTFEMPENEIVNFIESRKSRVDKYNIDATLELRSGLQSKYKRLRAEAVWAIEGWRAIVREAGNRDDFTSVLPIILRPSQFTHARRLLGSHGDS